MRKLIAPLICGIPATTHGPPAGMISYAAKSLLAADKTVGLEDLTIPLKPAVRAPNRFLTGAGNLGDETCNTIGFGAPVDLLTAGRASAFAVRATA